MDLSAEKQLKKIDKSKSIMTAFNNKLINYKFKIRKKKLGWKKS